MNINRPGCAAAVWDRRPLASFQDWVEALDPQVLPTARLILRAEAVSEAIAHSCQQAGTPSCSERGMLEGDIAALSHMFADVASADYLRVRLDVLHGAPALHRLCETTTIRLICMYRGPRMRFRQTAEEPHPVVALSPGVPIVVRGNSAPEHDRFQAQAVPNATASEICLVLTLDPVADAIGPSENTATTYH